MDIFGERVLSLDDSKTLQLTNLASRDRGGTLCHPECGHNEKQVLLTRVNKVDLTLELFICYCGGWPFCGRLLLHVLCA